MFTVTKVQILLYLQIFFLLLSKQNNTGKPHAGAGIFPGYAG